MIVHRLSRDFLDDDFRLMAIHTTMKDYRLVYFLNKILKIRLSKESKKKTFVGVDGNADFSYYHWYDESSKINWNCIANRSVTETKMKVTSLFESTTFVNYLIDNQRKIDFFLKINPEGRFDEKEIIKKIAAIPDISAIYKIDTDTLSSKHKLIFQEC
ncbi:hypothetical protein CAPN001_23140 [Capnocytophaga stomatis]|uniref:IPExxxVDY family protein n=1 Tax=Capnocytophaga stomatis TaxID=1848904 RepID=UPI0019501050|nr:IPExxxVDY family protein [Capnocytophaga stomatis]GIJ97745.1 hypothetical protein CAPN001_23140 [Capnocytophaga stomatis]